MIEQHYVVAAVSIAKIKDATVVVEVVVLDVHLKGRRPAPLPTISNIDVVVIPVERDSVSGACRTLKRQSTS